MAITLTKELLSAFVESATNKVQQTLDNNHITPFVFASTALLWLIPARVNHPLRRAIGLSTPFILITAPLEPAKKETIRLNPVQNIACGADPLEDWKSLTFHKDSVQRVSAFSHEWGCQRLLPLERNKARMLTAQYAQILPQLSGAEDKPLSLPMLVFTKKVDMCSGAPFYLTVFPPDCPFAFANVIAIKQADSVGATGTVEVLAQSKREQASMQNWIEYDLLGSPAAAELSDDAILASSSFPVPSAVLDDTDEFGDVSLHSADENNRPADFESPPFPNLAPSQSHVVLHAVWAAESVAGGRCKVELPPLPPPGTQWILELLSTPLAQEEPDASRSLRALYMEIKRLDVWCQCWLDGAKWIDGSTQPFETHPWQNDQSTSSSVDDTMEFEDKADQNTLEAHRSDFGIKIDEFIDTSIYDTRGSTTLGRLGRTHDIHALAGFPMREDLDFTERLWNLAHYAYDDSDLSETIAAVAEGLETKKLQPYIHHGNKSPLGQLIRDALQIAQSKTLVDEEAERERLAAQLDMWVDERPLDAFVHIGVHKLRADFWFYFVGGHLATPKQLEPFLDLTIEPEKLVPRYWLLIRALEMWWLVQQAVPGMPQQFVRQIVGALLSHFAAHLETVNQKLAEKDASQSAFGLVLQYMKPIKLALYLPMYSTEVQEFAMSIADGFAPARYTAMAASKPTESEGTSSQVLAPKRRMFVLTKTPALIDMHFAVNGDDSEHDVVLNTDTGEIGGEWENDDYIVFEAKLF
ncbi:hypothetical protein GGI25_003228 [Coemansia spiralis]|uniref:Uncharacterized protein n=2 Tax=Coemansia TaxID=4863 RepID=A0A9W8G2C4_9FUNG|nr:hypothetical protein EDC05_005751 [Coemansia umbellata]KAJ2619393.1 hypothetical protein GGI26_005854 [Coemansia sp. RSA 1358]KAJ2677133.1 hypothetical protein GGI25_003228 [Coemansia spiralis]